MKQRIHIFGASGSGTTTLGKELAYTLGVSHFDTDDFYWMKTDPPFQKSRELAQRQASLRESLARNESWVLSGSLCGWGDFLIPMFDLVVFLWIPQEIRMKRLRKREIERYGSDIVNPQNPRNTKYKEFLDWAESYDSGGLETRSKKRHEQWISELPCSVIRIEETKSLKESQKIVLNKL